MASYIESFDRRVIPNWRNFRETARSGELNDHTIRNVFSFNKEYIKKYISDWEFSKTVGTAADLVNAAFIADYNDKHIFEASKFLSSRPEFCSDDLLSLVSRNIGKSQETIFDSHNFSDSQKSFQSYFKKETYWEKIKFFRAKIGFNPANPIPWVEISRLYALIAEKEKAIHAIEVARRLAPNNRFVTRAYCRLLIHYREFDKTKYGLHKNKYLEVDPWVLSIDISLAQITEKSTKHLKKAIALAENKALKPLEISELASALGTIFFNDGKLNQSKRFFNLSLVSPNDNTLAQAEWVKSRNLNIRVAHHGITNHHAFEAMAFERFEEGKWRDAFQLAKQWLIDLPYSTRPVTMASYISTVFLKDYESAEVVCGIGLQANPLNPEIINNYCYLLGLQNRTSEAFKLLEKVNCIKVDLLTDQDRIALTGTTGLVLFREGFIEQGRMAYEKALFQCKKIENLYLYKVGLLNLLREEILARSEKVDELMKKVQHELKDDKTIEILFTKSEVDRLYYQTNTVRNSR